MNRYVKLLLLAGIAASSAVADNLNVVPFSLTTTGSFSSGTPKDLTFSASSFVGESDEDGFLLLGNLGTFTLAKQSKGTDVFHPKTDTFDLDITFLAPTGIQGSTAFEATLQGKVKRDDGSVFIDFGPTRSFTFANALASGGFDLTIDDVKLNVTDDDHTDSQVLTGRITNAFDPVATPEPQAVLLFATTILLSGSALRRWSARRR